MHGRQGVSPYTKGPARRREAVEEARRKLGVSERRAWRAWRRSTSSRAGAWENGYAESFVSRFRDELLAREEFESLPEARAYGTRYRLDYNHRRPHSALGYQAPAEFAALEPLPVTHTVLS